ncbi:MAG: putative bifunctional diguanylate cyclase/phosphodiesterase [Acidimicrobiales bacterium]
MTETSAAPTPEKRKLLEPPVLVALLTVGVLALSLALSMGIEDFYVVDGSDWPAWIGLVAAFALSERLVFHVEARNQAVSYTPTDLTLAIGMLFVSPVSLVVARTIGAAIGILVWRRATVLKLIFNLASFALETIVAIGLFRWFFGTSPEASPWVWLGMVGVLFIALVTGGVLVAVAISCFEGGLSRRVRKELANAPVFHLPGAVIASSISIPMLIEPWLGIISLSPAPVVWSVVRTHGALLHRYTDLTSVHEFSREVGNEAEPTDIAAKAVSQIAENLRAANVSLRMWDSAGIPVDVHHGRPLPSKVLPRDATDERWSSVMESRGPVSLADSELADDPGIGKQLASAELDGVLLAPLADDRGTLGVIVIRGRQGATADFDEDDANRLAAMLQQLAVAIRKGQFHAQIQHQATHDRLTGLPNRAYFEAWIDQVLGSTGQSAVLLIDLDRFKEINDTFGHHAGDEVLTAVSERIERCCSEADLAARFGGDEFAVFLPGADQDRALATADALSRALEAPFDLGAATVAIASSVGVVVSPDHGHDGATLIRRADIAMYDAKRRHVRSSLFRDDLEESDSVRLGLLADLRSALEDSALDVHYQPKIESESGKVVAAEALVRWNHAERGPISPEVFVGLAEQAGLIEALTIQVLDKALSAAAEWERRGWAISVAVNISAQSLLDEQLETLVASALERTGVDPALLTLEITESTMMGDPARTHRIMRGLNDLGLRLSVDDFGTGFSSLVNLRHLPVSELKIDKSFVSEMMMESNDEVIVKSTIDLGHNLGLEVVAEGVETESIQTRLGELGCDLLQGYGISKPLPLPEFVHWVENYDEGVEEQSDQLTVPPEFVEPTTYPAT